MKKNSIIAGIAFVALAGAVPMAKADIVTYSPVGTPNSDLGIFTATADGDILAYFAGADAGYTDLVGMLINGVLSPNGYGLANNPSGTTAIGQAFNIGTVHTGAALVFVLQVNNGSSTYYVRSDAGQSIYSTSYAGGGGVPAGTYVGFEDLTSSNDYDYNDETFVFSEVPSHGPNTSSVPEPTTVVAGALLLLPFGVSTLRILRNRKLASR